MRTSFNRSANVRGWNIACLLLALGLLVLWLFNVMRT